GNGDGRNGVGVKISLGDFDVKFGRRFVEGFAVDDVFGFDFVGAGFIDGELALGDHAGQGAVGFVDVDKSGEGAVNTGGNAGDFEGQGGFALGDFLFFLFGRIAFEGNVEVYAGLVRIIRLDIHNRLRRLAGGRARCGEGYGLGFVRFDGAAGRGDGEPVGVGRQTENEVGKADVLE